MVMRGGGGEGVGCSGAAQDSLGVQNPGRRITFHRLWHQIHPRTQPRDTLRGLPPCTRRPPGVINNLEISTHRVIRPLFSHTSIPASHLLLASRYRATWGSGIPSKDKRQRHITWHKPNKIGVLCGRGLVMMRPMEIHIHRCSSVIQWPLAKFSAAND